VRYDVYLLNYTMLGDAFYVRMEKHVDGDEIYIKDYSLYYAVVVKVSYDKELLNAIDAMKPEDGSYVYFAIANVSFTVTYQPSTEIGLAAYNTGEEPVKQIDITPLVVNALSEVAAQIQSAPESLIPSPVKADLLADLNAWMQGTYSVVTRHILTRVSFTWSVVDSYNVYENGTSIGGGADTVLSGGAAVDINGTDNEELYNAVLERANRTLAAYYPGGIKTFVDPISGVSPVLLYRAEVNKTEPMIIGQATEPIRVTNASLFFTAYPVPAKTVNGQEIRPTDLKLQVTLEPTSDYQLSTKRLVASSYYQEEYREGNKTYLITHNYTLTFDISAEVVKAYVVARAKVYDILVWVTVNPEIIAKKVEAVKMGSSRLIPALAPLGGNGIFSMLAGGASEIGFDSVSSAIEALSGMIQNSNFNWVLPTYFPVPMPHESIKIFAPGEYIGAYYMTSKIKLKGGFLAKIGKPLFSVMYEKVTMSMKSFGAGPGDDPNVGLVYMVNGKIKKSSGDEIRMYSLGFGVGEIRGKVIGPRFYLTPSSTGLPGDTPPELLRSFLNSKIVDFLIGENFITDLIDGILPGEFFSSAREIVSQMREHGLYPQITPYFGGSGSVWAYFMFSPKNTARFVASQPGDYVLSVKARFNMLHVRIFKIPILGIPIPIPVFISKGEAQQTVVHVRQIKALPLLVNYVVKPAETPTGAVKPLGPGQRFSDDSYIGIYAVPVWVDLNGVTPISPVLFRGQYGAGPNSTSLTIAAVSPNGAIIDGTDIYFFGVPLSFIKIPLNELDRLVPGPEGSIILAPAWKHGQTVSTINNQGAPTVLRVAKVRTFNLFFYDGKMITYTGVYDPGNKIHYYAVKAEKKVNELASMVQDKLAKINNTFLMVVSKVNTIEGLLSTINSTAGNLNDVLRQISQQLVNEIMAAMGGIIKQIVYQFVANAVAAVFGAFVPDPSSVITGYIQDILQKLIENALNSLIPDNGNKGINITDLITRYGLQILTFVALKVAYEVIGYQGLMNLLNQVKGLALKGVEMVTKVNKMIEYMLKIVNKTVEMSKYKPILLSTLHVYSLKGNEIPSEGILARIAGGAGENLVLPLDAVEANIAEGAVLYTAPYSTLTFIFQAITGAETGEYPNVAVSVQDTLLYIAAWANFVSTLLGDNGQSLQQVHNTLVTLSSQISLYIGQVQEWVEIPGIDTHTIILPSVTIVPPSKI